MKCRGHKVVGLMRYLHSSRVRSNSINQGVEKDGEKYPLFEVDPFYICILFRFADLRRQNGAYCSTEGQT